ncbi:MAG: metallophosphoesterase [Patescibacteria group bacterium]
MKALIFSDVHASNSTLAFLKKEISKYDLLIFSGDLTNMGEPVSFADDFILIIKNAGIPLFWVPGNNDFGATYDILNQEIPSLEGRVEEFKVSRPDKSGSRDAAPTVRRFTGVGGSPASWAGAYGGNKSVAQEKIAGTIFISHYPPPRIFNYLMPGKSEGLSPIFENSNIEYRISKQIQNSKLEIRNSSLSITKKLTYSPIVHICGHIHYQQGIAYLGETKIIKLASAETGHYGILDLDNLEIDFRRF